jgi:hypothetical protein
MIGQSTDPRNLIMGGLDTLWGAVSLLGAANNYSNYYLCLAKSSAATKDVAVLTSEGPNTIIAFTGYGDFGGQEPKRVPRTHILRMGDKLIRTRQLDRNDGGGLLAAPEKVSDLKIRSEFCRSASPSRVQGACGLHGGNEHTPRAIASEGVHSVRRCGPASLFGSFRPSAPIRS